ncbi:MAG: Bor/Iss family lipoprotein [Smithella sp.]
MTQGTLLRLTATVLLVFCFLTLQACHTLRFDIESEQHATVVEDTNWFFLFGWFPTREVDVAQKCPHGAAAIKEQTTFGDGLIGVITIDIVTPRSVWYYCLPAITPAKSTAEDSLKEGGK